MDKQIKTNIVSLLFAIGCLVLYFIFPIEELKFEVVISVIVFFVVLPILYTKFILHKNCKDIGFSSFNLTLKDGFFLVSSIVLGGLVSFFLISFGWGVEKYITTLPEVVFVDFKAFAVYELFLASILFLITFFSWGFVYSFECKKKIGSFFIALIMYFVLVVSFFESFWITIPMFVPVLFVRQIRDGKNILYMFLAVFAVALILNTLLVKSIT